MLGYSMELFHLQLYIKVITLYLNLKSLVRKHFFNKLINLIVLISTLFISLLLSTIALYIGCLDTSGLKFDWFLPNSCFTGESTLAKKYLVPDV